MGPTWPEWGSDQPRDKHYEKEYFIGNAGDMHAGEVLYHVGDVRVIRCHPCIAMHLWPLSTGSYLSEYYAKKFFQEIKPLYLQEYSEDKNWWYEIHSTVLDVAEKYIDQGSRILDIGAGPGMALEVAKDRLYDTTAVEPSPVAAAYLSTAGHRVIEGNLVDAHGKLPHGTYDIIYSWESLEHVPCPEDFLLQCHDLLRPGGVMAVAVPNEFTDAQFAACKKYGLHQWWVSCPDHQFYWSPVTLKLLFRRCGFKQRYMRMTYPIIEDFMLSQGKCYVGNPELGRHCHRERMQFEIDTIKSGNWPNLEAEYIDAVQYREGREIIGIFQKE